MSETHGHPIADDHVASASSSPCLCRQLWLSMHIPRGSATRSSYVGCGYGRQKLDAAMPGLQAARLINFVLSLSDGRSCNFDLLLGLCQSTRASWSGGNCLCDVGCLVSTAWRNKLSLLPHPPKNMAVCNTWVADLANQQPNISTKVLQSSASDVYAEAVVSSRGRHKLCSPDHLCDSQLPTPPRHVVHPTRKSESCAQQRCFRLLVSYR